MSAAASAALLVGYVGGAHAADMPIKAPAAPVVPASCGSFWDFVATSCPLSWYGITVYGTVDVGGGYQTHGAPFDGNFVTGASYFLQKMNRTAMWGAAPNGLSQSNIGIKANEPFAPGWSFVAQLEAGFDPYSLQFANSPGSLNTNNGVPLNLQSTNGDSSRAGQFYNSVGYLGVSSATYGTLTVFRQNALTTDGVIAYDPMGASYAFSPIGFSGTVAGAGDTELARSSSAVKYRLNIGDFRVAALGQFGGYGLNNGSNGMWEGQIGGDIRNVGPLFPGVLSVDAIYTYAKDAVSLGYAGCPACINGQPQAPFLPQVLTATISDQTSVMLLAKYTDGPLKLYLGYEQMRYAPPSDPQTSAFTDISGTSIGPGALVNGTPTGINNVAYTATCGTGVCSDKVLQAIWTGAKYAVTDNLDVVGAYYHYAQNTFTTSNCSIASAHSQCSGTMDAVSGLIDWRFAPKWDTYFGVMFSQFNGGLANGYLARNNVDPTVGVRFRF